jgi:hypothetical protein
MRFDGWADGLPLTNSVPYAIEFSAMPEKDAVWEFSMDEEGASVPRGTVCSGIVKGVSRCPENHYHLGIQPMKGPKLLMLYTMEIEQ